ncbi:MAG: hypothetical protein GWP91_07670 [Rhodobacterales bacterium]|nr:hypothetical protein [Rhodobacterales bacterium]
MRRIIALLLLTTACAVEETPPDPGLEDCDTAPSEGPSMDVSHFSTYQLAPTTVYCGIPPQGGAPYAPFGVRTRGISRDPEGLLIDLTAHHTTSGDLLGEASYTQRMICGNVGESAGFWVGSELHMRFYDYDIETLHGSEVEINITVSNQGGDSQNLSWVATLDCTAGDDS